MFLEYMYKNEVIFKIFFKKIVSFKYNNSIVIYNNSVNFVEYLFKAFNQYYMFYIN